MKPPIDPRKHGLLPPQIIIKSGKLKIFLKDLSNNTLQSINDCWETERQARELQGQHLISGPNVMTHYDSKPYIEYEYEWRNLSYEEECAHFNSTMKKYEADVLAYQEYTKLLQSKEEDDKFISIDLKIQRAQNRLANLLAIKAGTTIPFPE